MTKAVATPISPMVLLTMPLGSRFIAVHMPTIATPMLIRPLANCSRDRLPIVLRAFPRITIAVATAINPIPLLITPLGISCIAPAIAARDTAIPAKPLASSPHESLPICWTALPIIRTAVANAMRPVLLLIPFFGIKCIAPAMAAILTATPVSPRASSSQDKLPIVFTALARISIEILKAIIVPVTPSIFFFSASNIEPLAFPSLSNAFIANINSVISTPIAVKDETSFSESMLPISSNATASIPTAEAILMSMSALISFWYAFKHPLTSSRTPLMLAKTPLTSPKPFDKVLMNLRTPTSTAEKTPALAAPVMLPPASIFVIAFVIEDVTFTIRFHIVLRTLRILSKFNSASLDLIKEKNSFIFVIALLRKPTTLLTTIPKKLVSSAAFLTPVIHSPKEETPLPIPFTRPEKFLRRLITPRVTSFVTIITILITENKPLNADLTFAACSSLSLNFAVISRIRSVNLYNCSAVTGGNISLNASFIGLTTLINPLNAFQRA